MPLDITVDVAGPVPPYEQIRRQLADYIGSGLLTRGTRLPTMRALAADLGVAVGTVGRAYAELEAAGLVASRRRSGTVVTGAPAAPGDGGEQRVREAAAELDARARESGMDADAVLTVVRAALLHATR